MFVTLKAPLKEGEKFPVVLTFAKAGTVTTFLHIQAIGASGMGDMSTMKH
jgi:copper(I)-binding protein